MNPRSLIVLGLATVSVACSLALAQPADWTFTYQGKVSDGGAAANGSYDVQFKLFDATGAGTQLGGANCYAGAPQSFTPLTISAKHADSTPCPTNCSATCGKSHPP